MSSKLWVVRICIAFSVLVLFNLSTSVFFWWIEIRHFEWSMHWELICLYVLLYAIGGLLLGLRAEVFLNFRNVRFKPFNFIVLGIIPIAYLVFFVGWFADYWSYHSLPFFMTDYFSNYLSIMITSIWLGVAVGKAFYIRE